MDIRLDSNFDIALDHRNDLPVVEGREEFEQALRVRVTDYFYNIIGAGSPKTAASFVRVEARRVATDMDEIDNLSQIVIEADEDRPNTLGVSVIYNTGDDFTFTLSE